MAAQPPASRLVSSTLTRRKYLRCGIQKKNRAPRLLVDRDALFLKGNASASKASMTEDAIAFPRPRQNVAGFRQDVSGMPACYLNRPVPTFLGALRTAGALAATRCAD